MAIGIASYGAYVPWHRLGPGTKGWSFTTEKAIANFDEDSITMAVAAGCNCLDGWSREKIEALYFASTTPPYREKSNSTLISAALDLPSETLGVDFSSSIRAGTIALQTAVNAVKGGTRQVLVTAADMRVPQPGSELEPAIGDGAAALIIANDNVVAELEDSCTLSHEMLDVWRAEGDVHMRSWEDRFVVEEGFLKVLPQTVIKLLDRNKLNPKDITKVALYAPDPRRHNEIVRKLGFDPKNQVQDPLLNGVGNTGTACALITFIAALEKAKPGDRILLANYGDGADAFLFRVTEEIVKRRNHREVRSYVESKKILSEYETYAVWRGLINKAPPTRRPPFRTPSPSALHREENKNLRFQGTKCKQCGYPQFPPQRICSRCHAKDDFEAYRFSDRRATVFTYTMDRLAPTLDPPLVVCVIDFEGGGRMFSIMTDRDIDRLEIGMCVEMTFRRFYTSEGIHNYFWKCMPVRA